MADVVYGIDYWRDAWEAAGVWEWDPVDAGEKHGPVAQWLCEQVIDHENVDRDPEIITAAFEALEMRGVREFSPERLMTVLVSCQGMPPVSRNALLVTTETGASLWFDLACW